MKLLLASTSPFRQALLREAGFDFEAVAPGVDENAPEGLSPSRLACLFARQKAEAVAGRYPDAWVIGADQTVDLDGETLRKPTSRAEARRQLMKLQGRTHRLRVGVSVVRQASRHRRVKLVSVALTLRALSGRDLDAYLDTREWEGCAGGYRIEGAGVKLLKAYRGDWHAVVGLPMVTVVGMLEEAGYPLFRPGASRPR